MSEVITKIIQENRDELYEAKNHCEGRLRHTKWSLMYDALRNLGDEHWVCVKDRLPELNKPVGIKEVSGKTSEDKLVLKDYYEACGSRKTMKNWSSTKNMHVSHWCELPKIEENINPISAILDAHDLSQSQKTTFEEAAPFHCVYEDENGDDEIDDDMEVPSMVIQAIKDAREQMNYSNWHAAKFDAAIRVIERYCKEHTIPIEDSIGVKYTRKDITDKRIETLEQLCAEAYVVIGQFYDYLPNEHILDNLSELRLVHDDVIPFTAVGLPRAEKYHHGECRNPINNIKDALKLAEEMNKK